MTNTGEATESFDVVVEFYGYSAETVETTDPDEAETEAVARVEDQFEGHDMPVNIYADETSEGLDDEYDVVVEIYGYTTETVDAASPEEASDLAEQRVRDQYGDHGLPVNITADEVA